MGNDGSSLKSPREHFLPLDNDADKDEDLQGNLMDGWFFEHACLAENLS